MGLLAQFETKDLRYALGRYLWIRKMCLPSPPFHICDIGAGEGSILLRWCLGDFDGENDMAIENATGGHVGVDVNPDYNKTSRKLFPTSKFIEFDLNDLGNGKKLPFMAKEWDCTIASEVIEHLDRKLWEPFLCEMQRITRHILLVTCPDSGQPDRIHDRLADELDNRAYIGHQYEPCWFSWQRIMDKQFGDKAYCGQIPGFWTAVIALGDWNR